MGTYNTIITEIDDGIMTLTLNRPDKMNSFTREMMSEMMAAFDESDANDDVKAVIVNEALKDIEPMAWDFVANFARDNDLQMGEVCVLPEPPPAKK